MASGSLRGPQSLIFEVHSVAIRLRRHLPIADCRLQVPVQAISADGHARPVQKVGECFNLLRLVAGHVGIGDIFSANRLISGRMTRK